MEFRRGLTVVDSTAVDGVVEAATEAGIPVFVLDTGEGSNREAFFDAVRTAIPLDPPLLSARSWDALSDSAWEGLRNLDGDKIVVVWVSAVIYKNRASSEYETAVSVLGDLADSLADPGLTNGRPKEVSVFVGSITE